MSGLRLRSLLSTALLSAALLSPLALGAGVADAEPAAEPVVHVNLGDSFSAGTGIMPIDPASPAQCNRSLRNFAHQLADRQGYRLTDVSCGGAETADFTTEQYPGVKPQFDALHDGVDLVTLTIGGNDGSVFAGAVGQCTVAALTAAGDARPCATRHGDTFLTEVRENTGPAVAEAIAGIREAAPDAEVVVVGYPWLLPPTGGCFPAMPVAAGDVPYLRELQTELNAVIEAAATDNGARFADLSETSEGHDACAPAGTRWIEPIVVPTGSIPVHPNEAGSAAMAQAVIDVLADAAD